MAFKGTHNVQQYGSKVWQQRLRVSPNQRVVAGAILVMNSRSLKSGENTYQRKNNIHAKIEGVIEIKNKKVSIKNP
jgi:exosome complex RNA-binding protein Rrp4